MNATAGSPDPTLLSTSGNLVMDNSLNNMVVTSLKPSESRENQLFSLQDPVTGSSSQQLVTMPQTTQNNIQVGS